MHSLYTQSISTLYNIHTIYTLLLNPPNLHLCPNTHKINLTKYICKI